MSEPVKLKITKKGVETALSAEANGIKVRLSVVKFSTDRFASVMNDPRESLNNVVFESSIASGGTSITQNTLRFFSVINSMNVLHIGSVGLYTDDGILFAIASVEAGDLLVILQKISFVLSFGLTLSPIILENISIVIDEQGAVATGLIFEHENHENPHPQYNKGLLDAQKKIDDLTRLLDELKDRVEATEDQIEGIEGNSVNGGNFKFFVRHFTQANTIYPMVYKANGRPNGQNISYHMNKVSVEQLPNDSVVMTLDFTTYWVDSYHALYLPYSLEEPEITSIVPSVYSDLDVNDISPRIIRYGTDVINGKKYAFIVLMLDRVSPLRDSPYNGWCRMYATIRGRRKYQDVANLDVYPVSNILAP